MEKYKQLIDEQIGNNMNNFILEFSKKYKIDFVYKRSDVKVWLKDMFTKYNVEYTAKANMITIFADVEECTRVANGKVYGAFKIIDIKNKVK